MREVFVTELVKDVLGPRNGSNGIYEQLVDSPLDEFITGVLAPEKTRTDDLDALGVLPVTNVNAGTTYDGDESNTDVEISSLLSPALDPKSRPPSMGISFFVKSKNSIDLKICLTWARYFKKTVKDQTVWQREPRYSILERKFEPKARHAITEIDCSGDAKKIPEIRISIFIKPQKEPGEFFVSIFFVNAMKKNEKGYAGASEHIFQPQIRVVCGNDTEITQGFKRKTLKDEEDKMELLYRNRKFLARGHLVSALWRSIDPEQPYDEKNTLDYPDAINQPPFRWVDGELVSESERKIFSPPHVRSEFVPLSSIPSPEIEWNTENKPELEPSKLSTKWKPEELRAALMPLYDGYRKWTDKIENEKVHGYERISEKIISECKTVLERILLGIDLLCNSDDPSYDPDIALAFCFANKAIDVQAGWKNQKTVFKYRPFQLGFILMCLESIVNKKSSYRSVCDLMWVPTGTGKTEAYLALAAFTIAYRRRLALRENHEPTGAGVSVLTRYTLRLLTIQQFRRTLSLITASEFLRVHGLDKKIKVGWRPSDYPNNDDLIWGTTPFSVGLWIGSTVTPNHLEKSRWDPGAIGRLSGLDYYHGGEPAQVLECPSCGKNGILAIPTMGLEQGIIHNLHFVVETQDSQKLVSLISQLNNQKFGTIKIENVSSENINQGYDILTFNVSSPDPLKSSNIDEFWQQIKKIFEKNGAAVRLVPARASRPGYFFRTYLKNDGQPKIYDFEIFCPNPSCKLKVPWCGGAPNGKIHNIQPRNAVPFKNIGGLTSPDENVFTDVIEPFQNSSRNISNRIPIPALTVDDQIYQRAPTVVVSTSDKLARPPYEPDSAAIFGNVDHHHNIYGYYRPTDTRTTGGHPSPAGGNNHPINWEQILPLLQPDIILQDELHLIEGALGSMVGIYETAVDFLASGNFPVKYIASTATIRRAEEHVQSLFIRGVQLFPPHGTTSDDRFFVTQENVHPLNDKHAGRLYIGICAPGRGPLTPLIRIWSRLSQTTWDHRNDNQIANLESKLDPFWTLTGYFNAVRELAGAMALYRQDIRDRALNLSNSPRPLHDENSFELSGRTEANDLPGILDMLEKPYTSSKNSSPDALFTTSMFGTGVDISRLGLMIVNGQPKTTSSYIQSTGRVGRSKGALVVTFYRSSRPRDLNHYEFFSRHHLQIQRFVEAPTVYPFASSLMDRAIGPVGVFILRNMRTPVTPWAVNNTAVLMGIRNGGYANQEVTNLPIIFQNRELKQPVTRKSKNPKMVERKMSQAIETWQGVASKPSNADLRYWESREDSEDLHPVVLGDERHQDADQAVVYRNSPQSLRDLEQETGFQT